MTTLRAVNTISPQVYTSARLLHLPTTSLAKRCPRSDSLFSTHWPVLQQRQLSVALRRQHRSPQLGTSLAQPYSTQFFGPSRVQSPNKPSLNRNHIPQLWYKDPRTRTTYESSFGSWILVAVGVVIGLLYSVSTSDVERFNKTHEEHEESKTPDEALDNIELQINKMTGEALPGRPGTLTVDQEEKLKELWVETLLVFGVIDPKDPVTNGNSRSRADTTSSKKPKKKRMSLFSRGKGHDDDEADGAISPPADDDKYGQTKEFHEALATLPAETLRTTFWDMVKHDNPDALLLRFLRARKWDVKKALVMMISTMKWRVGVHIDDDIMARGELGMLEDSLSTDKETQRHGHDFITQMRMGKSFLHGIDKNGRPMCFVRVRLHRQGEQSEQSLERYTIFVIESARLILNPPVDTACVVFDMTGFSMANMDYTPVKFMIKCFEANYPESLGVVLVHKAPWIFQGIWKVIKGWLDPVVASKIQFTSDDAAMEEFVPRSQIITELGGHEDWTYRYFEPVPGENDIMKDIATRDKLQAERNVLVKEYEASTLEWIQGSGDQGQVKLKRMEIFGKMKEGYWALDPYVRAKSYYDRCGMIKPGGVIHFYPQKEMEKVPVAALNGNGAVKPVETSAEDVD